MQFELRPAAGLSTRHYIENCWPTQSLSHIVTASRKTIIAMPWVYLAIAIVAEVIETSFLKMSEGFTKLWLSMAVMVGYGVAFFFLSLTLRSIPVGIAYAIWSGVGVSLVTLIAGVAFDQRLDLAGILGIGLIICGVIVLNLFSKTTAR